MKYRVLREGLSVRDGHGGWFYPKPGEDLEVSDLAAPSLRRDGYIEEIAEAEVGGEDVDSDEERPKLRGRLVKGWRT